VGNEDNHPTVVAIEGDGIGLEVTPWTIEAVDAAVKGAYGGEKSLRWVEALAGKRAMEATGSPLPPETVELIRTHTLALKGPVETPVGGGIRSVNVALRKVLDLYACIRPVRYFKGVTAPVKEPEKVDVVIFRENVEDVYAGIEWREGSPEAHKVIRFLNDEMGFDVRLDSGIGVKPMSVFGSKRLVARAIEYATERGRASVTLVHKGNIMKYTEGAFRDWGYEVATECFPGGTIRESELESSSDTGGLSKGTVLMNDRIADNMFQEMILHPERYDVLALPNLDGDYMSDAVAAQVGGVGIAPGANIGDHAAVFEATHGTAPDIVGQGKANPCSLMLSATMLLSHLGWDEAAERLEGAIERLLASGRMTIDLAAEAEGVKALSTDEFGRAVISEVS
jgi:isocitrate dehydrogenase